MISEKEESVFKCTMKIIGVGVEGIFGLKVILFFAFDPDGERTERYYENAQREMQAQMEYWRNALADRTRQEQGGFTDSLRYARVLEAGGSQTQRRERRADAQQQNTVRNMLNLPTRLMLTDGNVMTTVRREPPVVIEVD